MKRPFPVVFVHAAAATAAIAAAAAPARADERDDEIRELRSLVRQQADDQAKLRAEFEAFKADRGVSVDDGSLRAAVEELLRDGPGSRGSYIGPGRTQRPVGNLDVGGYFSTRYANSALPGSNPAFQDMRLILQAHAQISRAVSFDGEIEVEHGGIGGGADGEVVVEYAELKFAESEEFALKAGTLLAPWGRFNAQHDDPLNELSSRPTVSRYVHGVVLRGPGVGVEGVLAPSDDVSFNYDVIVTNGLSDDFSSGDGIRDSRTLWEDDDNHDKTVFGRFGVVPSTGFADALDLGASFAAGRLGAAGDDEMFGYGFDAAAKWGPWEVKGEWAQLDVDRSGAAPPIDGAGNLGPIRGLRGWYGQVVYRIAEPWVRALPFADDSASIGLVLRRDAVDLNDRVRGADGPDDERAWSVGVNYRPTTKTVLKLELRFAQSGFPGDEGDDRDLIVFEFATYF